MRKRLVTLLLLSLLASPLRAQVSPQLTQSSVAGGGGVSTQGPTRVEGTVGQASAGVSSGGAFTLYGGFHAPGTGPSVQSVVRASANPTMPNSTVGYSVTFNAPVTGVDASDFQLTTSGLSGASVTGVSGSGAAYSVTVGTGTPAAAGATLRLDVADDDTIRDAGGAPLGGEGAGNGNFTSGEVYTVNPVSARANDAKVSEPSTGKAALLFTVTLSAPATGALTVNYATADGAATPATGGASCGGAVDYESAGGTLSFAAGEQFKVVSINACADASAGESNETLLLNLSGAVGGDIQVAQATGTITQGTTAGTLLISELRTSGPAGPGDDFLELYNNTDSPLTVDDGSGIKDAAHGYGVYKMGADCAAAPVLVGVVPNGTVIQARGHFLLAGGQYSLKDYGATDEAKGDVAMTADIEADRNLAVFSTADPVAISSATRLDAVGFGANGTNTGAVCDLLREGSTLPAVSGTTTEHSFFRKECDFVGGTGCAAGGNPKDSNDNAADFMFADTTGASIGAATPHLGAPGPQGSSSPFRRDNTGIGAVLLDGSKSSSASPNRSRDFNPNPANNSQFGTLTIRRRVVNNTASTVTRLRVRIVEMTTYPNQNGSADLRAVTAPDEFNVGPVGDAATCAAAGAGSPNCMVTVKGTTLETPPAQAGGGGYNSTLSVPLPGAGLAPNGSTLVQFVLGVQQPGTFRFYIIVEALP